MTKYEFRPLTLVPRDKNFVDQKQDFLTDELFLEGIIMRTCSDREIYHSNAFMVKIEEGNKEAPDKYKKIQDKVFFKAYAKVCCREELCRREDCRKSDSYAAEIVVEKMDALKKGIWAENEYVGKVRIITIPASKGGEVREGIRYICKRTGYTEIAFPVRLYGRTMGAFIVGQIIAKEDMDNWCESIEKRCESAQYNKEEVDEIKKNVKEAKTEDEIKEIIEKVSWAVADIEKELIAVYESRQKQYGLEQGNIYVEKFKCNFKIEKKQVEDTKKVFVADTCIEIYEKLGSCIRDCISDFCHTVGVKRYVLFLPDEKNLIDNDYAELRSGEIILKVKALVEEEPEVTALYGNVIVGKYVKNMDFQYDYVIISEAEGYPMALLIGIEEFLQEVDSEAEKKLLRESISNIFRHIFSYVGMAGIQVKSEYFRAYLDSSMSIMRHELGQSNAGYKVLLEKFRSSVSYYSQKGVDKQGFANLVVMDLFQNICEDFIKDSERYLYTTKIRINSTKYLTEFEPKEKQFFYPYEEFLFKWQQIYHQNAEKNNLDFKVPHVSFFDMARPRMYGDSMMIEQAVYNLTNNAIKYALRGTRVSLDCRLSADKNRYEIIVKNVGHPLSEQEQKDIFEYGRRGSNNRKGGSGLGLYLTKQIAMAHGGNVEFHMEPLSEYNWSLVELYMYFYEDKNIRYLCKDQALYDKLKEEWKLKKVEIEKYVVRKIPHNEFSSMYVQQNIKHGTADFTFIFWIPYVE